MDIDLETAVAVFQILTVTLSLGVAGQLVTSQVGVVRGETVITREGVREVFREGLEGVVVDLGVSTHHESAELVKRYAFFPGEIVHGSCKGFPLLHLLIP